MQQFKQLLQRQQQQACMAARDIASAASSTYQPEQLQQAEQIWHDLRVRHMHLSRYGAVHLVALTVWSNVGCFMCS